MKRRSPLLLIAVSLLVLGLLLSVIRGQGHLQFLELAAYDLLIAGVETGFDAPPAVTLVLVTEADIQSMGNWPLNDLQLRDILKAVLALGPRVVGLDIYRDLAVEPGNAELHNLFATEPRIIGIEKFPDAKSAGVPPPPALRDTGRVGFSDLLTDPGGVVRRNLLFLSQDERTGYAFSLQMGMAYLIANGIQPAADPETPGYMRLGQVTLAPLEGNEGGYVDADAGGYQVMLRFRDHRDAFPTYGLTDLRENLVPGEAIRDRIVIIGVSAESVKDQFITPFAILDHDAGTFAGSLIHAHATQQILDTALYGRAPLRAWSDRVEWAWIGLWLFAGFVAGWFSGPSWRFALVVLSGIVLNVMIAGLAFRSGWWLPVVPNLLGWVLAAGLSSAVLAAHRQRDQQALMSLFSRHVSPQVATAIWQRREEVLEDGRLVPRTLTVTTLFSDLQGFTQVSEQMEPEPFLQWLNSYMAELTDVIMQHGGILDDYAGDGIKASFGVPFCDPDGVAAQAEQAVLCAFALQKSLTELNHQWNRAGRASVAMRIGIHTGEVVVGTVGSPSRMKYTTVGRNVNLASRLESLRECPGPIADDDRQNCRILVSEQTAGLVADTVRSRDLGLFDLKGIVEKTRVFAILGPDTEGHANV